MFILCCFGVKNLFFFGSRSLLFLCRFGVKNLFLLEVTTGLGSCISILL